MPIPSHLILDLDDTILDFTAPGAETWADLIPQFSGRMGIPAETLREAVLASSNRYWSDPIRHREGRLAQRKARRTYLREAFHTLGLEGTDGADELADAFSREREARVRPFPGALAALAEMRSAGARMVLLTNGESALQRTKVVRFALARFFDAILIEEETGCGKPSEQAYRGALDALGAPPSTAWMIGDDPAFDIAPARALGMHTAWVRLDLSADEVPGADLIVGSLRELADRWTDGRKFGRRINSP
jgi:putative hydrolase of the HAD superfamily